MRLRPFATEVDATISAVVRALTSGRGLAPEVLTEVLGVTKTSVYNKLRGSAPWKASEVKALADYFAVEVADIYDGLGGRFDAGVRRQGLEPRTR